MGDLFHPERLPDRLKDIVEWKNLTVAGGYRHKPITAEEMYSLAGNIRVSISGICLRCFLLSGRTGKAGPSGSCLKPSWAPLRDIDFGIYPYTSSSSTIAAYAPIGAGIPNHKIDESIGIMKAYSSCVGEGPFTCELFGAEGDRLREAGGEYGAATGRPRRVGGFDVVASVMVCECRVQTAWH